MLDNDIFGNLIVPGEDELNSYIPKFWKKILEMNANNYFAGYTLDRMAQDIQQMVYDRFFDSCSLAMLTRYEEFLKITNTDKMSVADRRATVKMRWNGSGKMTGSRIRSIVKECCNCDCDVTFGSSQLIIDTIFKFEENPIIYVAIIRNMIENSTFPAHIEIVFRCNINLNINNRNQEQVQLRRLNLQTLFQDKTGEIATSQILKTKIDSFTESIEASVTTLKNAWYFDGTFCFDGEKLFNAEVKKEVL